MTRFHARTGSIIAAAASVILTPALFGGPNHVATRQAPSSPVLASPLSAVASVGITVSDLDASIAFYSSVLEFQVVSEVESTGPAFERLTGVFGTRCRTARLRLGDESIDLTQYLAPEGRPIPADARSNDHSFQHIAIVVSDMDRAYTHLRAHKVRHASSGPQTLPDWNPNAGGISAFYFKDPDGHVLEVIHFPPGKGDPRWQHPDARLFLGIDHTAIVVADTDRSIAFYQDVLGMRVAGESENHGTEQEHLNNVFGARLRITALRAPHGPGVELLEYLAPSDGRPAPPDTRANDITHWHTTMLAPDMDLLASRLRDARIDWTSPGVIHEVPGFVDFESGCHVRDPDGHAVLIGQARDSAARVLGAP